MRQALIAVLLLLAGLAGCRTAAPQPRPAPAPARSGAAAALPLPDLAGGPEHATRPHQDPPLLPVGAYMRGDPRLKLVALTFDDGPDAVFTPQILDLLKAHQIRATFFVVGARAAVHPDLVLRMVAEGHEIGNHSYHHPLMTKLAPRKLSDELRSTDAILRHLTGHTIRLFRPPYGATNPRVLKAAVAMGYKVIIWDIDSLDWKKGVSTAQVEANVLPNLRPGAIILEHAAGGKGEDLANTVQALPVIIRTLKERGYRPVTISELLATGDVRPGRW